MRLATAKDELRAAMNPRVKQNTDYINLVLIASVVKLDEIENITPEIVEKFYAVDMNFLVSM